MPEKSPFKRFVVDERYLFLIVLVAAITLFSIIFEHILSHAPLSDEGYYLAYAGYVDNHGISGFFSLFKGYLENRVDWVYPNPLRIGYILLSTLWLEICGFSLTNLTFLSFFCYCFFIIASFYYARKYFSVKFALLFSILLAFSPLNMAMAKIALIESAYCLFSSLSLWLFLDYVKEDSDLKRALFVLVCSFTILIKETAVLLCPFFIIFLLFRKLIQKRQVRLKDFLCSSLFPLTLVFLSYAALGGINNTMKIITIIINSPKTNPYALAYGGGPWYRYLIDYMLLSPTVTILGIGFIFYYLFSPQEERSEEIDYFLLFFIFIFLAFNFFTKNIRYVINLDMPFRIFSLLILTKVSQSFSKEKRYFFLAGLVLAIAMLDLVNFNYLFMLRGIGDPCTLILLKARHIIP